MFSIDVSGMFGEEYRSLVFDIIRMLCIHLTIQFMFYIGSDKVTFFSAEFVVMVLYAILGLMIFWLIVQKITHIK